MNLAGTLFRKHGQCSFEVWLEKGLITICIAVKQEEGALVGFMNKDLWACIEWQEPSARLQAIENSPHFQAIEKIQVLKKGWFALSTVAFTTDSGEVFVGRTDKQFIEFLLTLF